jgi:phosphopentomutase
MARRAALVVLDGLGCGAAPDAAAYGDAGSDTLGNVARAVGGLALPALERLGLGRCHPIAGLGAVERPAAATGRMRPASAGKDSTTGHWELCGVVLDRPLPTYPHGFPASVIDAFAAATGRGVLGNRAASGTAILDELGAEHCATGRWIVYTSADSVFQVAAHVDVVPLAELYAACAAARALLVGEHAVSRVIARPFAGGPGSWTRTADRRDLSVPPPGETLLDALAAAGVPRVGVGKVDDLFAGRAIASTHTATNAEAYRLIGEVLDGLEGGFLLANVIEFDQAWGHRNDVPGFHRGLRELDAAIGPLLARLRPDDLVIITADHGNDPTTPSTDHSREEVPLLVTGPRIRPVDLGLRSTFADAGQTVAELLGARPLAAGRSFLNEVWSD